MKMVQKRILESIKEHLEKTYGLDMFAQDVRFAYVIYYVYMTEFNDIVNLRMIMRGALDYTNSNTFAAFSRSIYRTLEKMGIKSGDYLKTIFKIAKEIKF